MPFHADSDARFVCQQAARAIASLPHHPNRTTAFHYSCESQPDSWQSRLPPTSQPDDPTEPLASDQIEQIEQFPGNIRKHPETDSSSLVCRSLWAWGGFVSPHIAAARAGEVPQDSLVLDAVRRSLHPSNEKPPRGSRRWTVIETAGGVASPGPSGTLQADMYRYTSL